MGTVGRQVVMKAETLMSIANFHVHVIHSDENLVLVKTKFTTLV